ncbi:tail fiber assembly protein [Enterobacter mori]|uniref:tail fiber assembly protein n=1 Tax=Enterobacter mori TaxID=539813 RepID=UPI002DBBED40|nr:tail fiber assembly protein [Enterobacter mori]MEB7917473.1 tail fiber assembly protein [Enterobacter mori]
MNEKYYYSAKENAFYPSLLIPDYVEAGTLPDDVKEISTDWYTYLLNCQAMGRVIRPNEFNLPVPSESPPPTQQELRGAARKKKAQIMRMVSEKIAVLNDSIELGISTKEEEIALLAWRNYRVMVSRVQTDNPVWPEEP